MSKRIIKIICLSLFTLLSSCTGSSHNESSESSSGESSSDSSESSSEETKYFTVTWKNYDGAVLEVDKNVKEGETPSYDGKTPTRPDDEDYTYTWTGWNPSIKPVVSDQTYTATYELETKSVLSKDGKTVTYGLYPQTNVNDATLLDALNKLETTESNGWYLYKNEFYAKISATPFDYTYLFDNGYSIVNGETYWFKCEPITWNVLSYENGEYFLLSSLLLDAHCYALSYSNNYKESDIRAWLNDEFYKSAFSLGNKYIQTTTVDNSPATTNAIDNPYACENTEDKVFLPSYQDFVNEKYGFSSDADTLDEARQCKTTDYVRAIGGYCDNYYMPFYSYYWMRSPIASLADYACYVDYNGSLSGYYVDSNDACIRPSIVIKLA